MCSFKFFLKKPLFETQFGTIIVYGVKKDAQMPKGIPTHLFSFPECYNAENCGEFMTLTPPSLLGTEIKF